MMQFRALHQAVWKLSFSKATSLCTVLNQLYQADVSTPGRDKFLEQLRLHGSGLDVTNYLHTPGKMVAALITASWKY